MPLLEERDGMPVAIRSLRGGRDISSDTTQTVDVAHKLAALKSQFELGEDCGYARWLANTAGVRALSTVASSIHTLDPLEIGGTTARRGFAIQDHVAAFQCLEMLEKPTLSQVWCESQDDVTLIWENTGGEEVEFVQVKGHEFDQLWTVAKLINREAISTASKSTDDDDDKTKPEGKSKKAKAKTYAPSILERSLQYDRCCEPVLFRIVTARPVKSELNVLTYERGSTHRERTTPQFIKLLAKVQENATVNAFRSPNGNGCDFWLDRTYWVCEHSIDALRDRNLLRLKELVEHRGHLFLSDQVRELYQRFLTKVQDGGLARWDREANKKKITRIELLAWFADAIDSAAHPAKAGTGKTLRAALTEAGIPSTEFETISMLRQAFRRERLTPAYSEPHKQSQLEATISARLLELRSDLDSLLLSMSGIEFHAACINAIRAIHAALPVEERPPVSHMYGFMYALTDRGGHRFVRAKP